MHLDKRVQLFVVLAGLFVTSLVVGDLISVKLIEVARVRDVGFVLSVGMLPFPVTFLLTDLLNEFYGKRAARFVTLTGFAMALFAYAVVFTAVALPWAPFTRGADWGGTTPAAFDNVFAGGQRILAASMAAYLVGQFIDISVFNALKRLTRNRHLWLRATGSTLLSQLIDTVVVQVLAWTGVLPAERIVSIVLTSYALKLVIAVALTPLLYAGHGLVERRLGMRPVVLGEDGEPLPEPADEAGSRRAA